MVLKRECEDNVACAITLIVSFCVCDISHALALELFDLGSSDIHNGCMRYIGKVVLKVPLLYCN